MSIAIEHYTYLFSEAKREALEDLRRLSEATREADLSGLHKSNDIRIAERSCSPMLVKASASTRGGCSIWKVGVRVMSALRLIEPPSVVKDVESLFRCEGVKG